MNERDVSQGAGWYGLMRLSCSCSINDANKQLRIMLQRCCCCCALQMQSRVWAVPPSKKLTVDYAVMKPNLRIVVVSESLKAPPERPKRKKKKEEV